MDEKRWHGIGRTVLVLGIASLLTDVSSEAIYPLIPLFLVNVLHTSVVYVGLIEGIAESTASVLKVFSGWLSDAVGGRKWITVAGYTLSTLSKPLLSISNSWGQVLAIRFADRAGKGIRSAPRDALIADVTPPEYRGVSYGFHGAMDTTGAVAGPLLAFWMLRSLHVSFRHIFMLSAVPAILAVLVLAVFVRERYTGNRLSGALPSLKLSSFDTKFRKFLLVAVLFSLGNSSDVFLILRAQNIGISVSKILLVYVLYNVVFAGLDTAAGAVSDKLGRKGVLLCGFAVYALVYAGFGLATRPIEIWFLFGFYGLYAAMTDGVMRAFAADLVGAEVRGTGLGTYQSLTGVALLPASLIAGLLWRVINPAATFFFGAILAASAAALLAIFFRPNPTYSDR